ncbi:MAG: DNA polymerase domain-containing protein [Anaerolineales bacterium]
MTVVEGWLFDLYPSSQGDLNVWLLTQQADGTVDCRLYHQDFTVTFYAAGTAGRLRQLWRYLQGVALPLKLERVQRRDIFQSAEVTLLAVHVENAAAQPSLFQQVVEHFPDLTYYDADIPISLRHAARYASFPLANCRVEVDAQGKIQHWQTLDSPWDLDPPPPPLRILTLEPNVDPFHAPPTHLLVRSGRFSYRLALEAQRPFLINLRAILQRHDPDLLLTRWGDTWLIPLLLRLAQEQHLPLPLNRDAQQGVAAHRERSYFSYGQVIYRGQQAHLFGRWHLDAQNAVLFHDYGLDGALEMARVTALPLQSAARSSPGSGISAMQMRTALQMGILVPWHKQQPELSKTAYDLFQTDQGGLVYQPLIGLHEHVAELDFISMYPSIMERFNISPETITSEEEARQLIAQLRPLAEPHQAGLIPQTLSPLLKKRLELKTRLAELAAHDPRRKHYKACASAHKWLLVTCFGYLGYKNARFGRIEAHEAVTAYGREALLRAKEAAEDQGFEVLHMYVDGLWVRKAGAQSVQDFQPLLEEISRRTSLPIALDGIYRWVAFLPSRRQSNVPVANRYFGVFQDGSLKVRGIELRRRDTPLWIAEMQEEVLKIMAKAADAAALQRSLPLILIMLRRRVSDLRRQRVALEKLIVSQKLSRTLEEYRDPSPAARAAAQLQAIGKTLRPGQCVRFIYVYGEEGVHAWDLPRAPSLHAVNVPRYIELLVRSMVTLLQPLGIEERWLRDFVASGMIVEALPLPLAGGRAHQETMARLVG